MRFVRRDSFTLSLGAPRPMFRHLSSGRFPGLRVMVNVTAFPGFSQWHPMIT